MVVAVVCLFVCFFLLLEIVAYINLSNILLHYQQLVC